jgi:hypothetical protein
LKRAPPVTDLFQLDTNGSAYVAGQTCSLDFPLARPLQAISGGNCDARRDVVRALSARRADTDFR